MSEQGKVDINSKRVGYQAQGSKTHPGLQGCTHSSGSTCWSGDRQQQGLSRRRRQGLSRRRQQGLSGIQVLTAAHLICSSPEAKQEHAVRTTSVVRQMGGGIFLQRPSTSVLPVSRHHTPGNTASGKMMHLTSPLDS